MEGGDDDSQGTAPDRRAPKVLKPQIGHLRRFGRAFPVFDQYCIFNQRDLAEATPKLMQQREKGRRRIRLPYRQPRGQ